MAGEAATPAASFLFTIDSNQKKLSDDSAKFFHFLMAKLLYLAKRAWPDILTTMAFHTTRVKSPEIYNQKKLARVIK